MQSKGFEKVNRIWKKATGIYNNIELYFIALFTLIVGVLILVQVARRAMGMQGWPWVDELSRYMLITTTLIGSSYAVKSNGHMVMDLLYNYIPVRPAYLLKGGVYMLCGVFYTYLSYHAYLWTGKLKMMKRTWETMPFKLWWVWVLVVVALLTMGFRYIVQGGICIKKFTLGEKEFSEMNTKEM